MRLRAIFATLATALSLGCGGVTEAASLTDGSFLAEPILGYHVGSLSEQGVSFDMNGVGFGARVGWELPVFFVAADVQHARRSLNIGATSTSTPHTSLGITAGAKVREIRLWGGLNFINRFRSANTDATLRGTGFKLGAGYPVVPGLSLNVEYFFSPISKGCTAAGDCSDIETSANFSSVFFSVSAPFIF